MNNKKIWLVVGVIVILAGGAIGVAVLNKDSMSSYTQPGMNTPSESLPVQQPDSQPSTAIPGTYQDYTDQAFTQAEGRRWLFFHAGWCPQCRELEESIKKQGVPDGITIFKVDYDSQTALKKKYGVTLQTTVVEVDENGNEIKKFVAYNDPTLAAVVEALGG